MAMATENIVLDRETEEMDTPRAWDRFKGLFGTGQEFLHADPESLAYERRLWDNRIEEYLDQSLPDYLMEFGVLDEIALHVRDERLADLEGRTHELMGFARSLDEELGQQEERLAAVEKLAKRKAA